MKLTDPFKLSELQRCMLDVLEQRKEVTVEELVKIFDSTWDVGNVRANMSNLRTKMRQTGDRRTVLFDRASGAYRLVSLIQ